jgi:RNA polymerase sigma factor (sigma-70 family)
MSESDDYYTKEEMWLKLKPLFDYPKDEQGHYLEDKNGNRLPSDLEKMARNIIPSGTDINALNYGPTDLAQDTVLRCIEGHKSFKKGTNLEAWVKTVMQNRWIDLCRLKWPKREVRLPHTEGEDGELKDPMDNFPDTGLTATQIYARKRCFRKLSPPSHKEVFKYHTWGFKLRQIAEKTNTNINTIATWLTAAKKAYRSCLDDQGAI